MGIDFSRFAAGMSHHFQNVSQINSIFKAVRRKT